MRNNNPKILIIDDEEIICDACSQVLQLEKYQVETSLDGLSGLKKLDEFKPDVVFVDLKMPGIGGMEVLEKIREKDSSIVSVVITGYATIESAVESMKKGAYDFLPKPFSPEELTIIARRALEKREMLTEAKRLREEKERMRQNFISLVSHEMRTPLVAVMQYIEVISGGLAGEVNPDLKKIIDRMKVRLNELLELIGRWLKFARIEEMNLKEGFRDFPLSQVIEEAVELVKPLAQPRGITLTTHALEDDIKVRGDREMLKEVFVNLLSNGIKYNRENGSVAVHVRKEEDSVTIDISDTGIGIPKQALANIGEEFYRVKKEGLAAGFGLGLAIVKKILDIHNGRLEIKSRENEGSTFIVRLPRSSVA